MEKAERGKKAQLAYSFDIALQNEFSIQENIALARQFLLENFVGRGMVVDFAVHQPDREDGGIQNPHFHVLCPIRPILPDGRWGSKQRREYVLDEHGERIRDGAGNYVFSAVPTTDWGSPETLEHWRRAWAELCNAKFVEKGMDCRIDHRSYERQGVEQLPTVHEGPTVKVMEQKGIRTDRGDLNRWIRKTNAMLREAKQKIASLLSWLKEVKDELSVPQPPTLVELLSAYYDDRNRGAYSGKAKIENLKKFSETVSYLESKQLRTTEDLDALLNSMQEQIDTLKESASGKQARIKELDELLRMADCYQQGKPVADKLKTIRFEKSRQKYKAEHENVLWTFYMAERKLKDQWVDGKISVHAWRREKAKLETEYQMLQQKIKPLHTDTKNSGLSITASIRCSMSRSAKTPLHGRKSRKSNTKPYTFSGGTYGQQFENPTRNHRRFGYAGRIPFFQSRPHRPAETQFLDRSGRTHPCKKSLCILAAGIYLTKGDWRHGLHRHWQL